jgi:hypothetical protein
MCKCYEDHRFIVIESRLAILEDGAGYRCWKESLWCTVCGYEDVDYRFRKLNPAERQARPNRGRPRKHTPAYLKGKDA